MMEIHRQTSKDDTGPAKLRKKKSPWKVSRGDCEGRL